MNFDQKTPIYQQLAESIRQDILSGALPAEMAIPSVRQISRGWPESSDRFKCNTITDSGGSLGKKKRTGHVCPEECA